MLDVTLGIRLQQNCGTTCKNLETMGYREVHLLEMLKKAMENTVFLFPYSTFSYSEKWRLLYDEHAYLHLSNHDLLGMFYLESEYKIVQSEEESKTHPLWYQHTYFLSKYQFQSTNMCIKKMTEELRPNSKYNDNRLGWDH